MSGNFIDLFAGCGGLSLGLIEAGWKAEFAIEKTKDAFDTLIHNLSSNKIENGFTWPEWLPCENMTTSFLLDNFRGKLENLEGKIDLIAGGPPCQGFSFAGLRNPNDPRNRLTEEYIEIVSIIKPKYLMLENVKGFQAKFAKSKKDEPYSDYVVSRLENLEGSNYKVFTKVLPASSFAIPQPRPRFVLIAIRNDVLSNTSIKNIENEEFYSKILSAAEEYKNRNGLNKDFTPLKDAIGDLEVSKNGVEVSVDNKSFNQISYKKPRKINPYLKLMKRRAKGNYKPDSLRMARHGEKTLEKFNYFIEFADKGKTLSKEIRKKFNIKKQCFTMLSPNMLSTTITTLPDDCLHYSEPRILTVRENARIQSFPDWFEFKGKYTTGGPRRKEECPRYTQVGNAVPPLMAEILGLFMKKLSEEV